MLILKPGESLWITGSGLPQLETLLCNVAYGDPAYYSGVTTRSIIGVVNQAIADWFHISPAADGVQTRRITLCSITNQATGTVMIQVEHRLASGVVKEVLWTGSIAPAATVTYIDGSGWGGVLVNTPGLGSPTNDGTLLFGLGIPSSVLGINGDSYFDIATNSLYKKISGAWAFITTIATSALVYVQQAAVTANGTLTLNLMQAQQTVIDVAVSASAVTLAVSGSLNRHATAIVRNTGAGAVALTWPAGWHLRDGATPPSNIPIGKRMVIGIGCLGPAGTDVYAQAEIYG